MKFIDFFAGVGGFRKGMEMAGHECVGFCEFDKHAVASYTSMHLINEDQRRSLEKLDVKKRQKEILKEEYRNGEWYANDIRTVDDRIMPKADCWCFGFPCQDISVAGKQLGFNGHRSSLFFAVTKLIRELKEEDRPKYLFIENVKNLLSVNGGFDFAKLLIELDEIGYDAEWSVLNSKNFGVPQNRERVFIIANLRSRGGREILPLYGENAATLKQLIGGNVGGIGAKTGLYLMGNLNPSGKGQGGNVYHEGGIEPTVTTNKGSGTHIYMEYDDEKLEPKENVSVGYNRKEGVTGAKNVFSTLSASDYRGLNRNQTQNAVMEVRSVLTPERMEKRQNGRRMKEDGEPMFTLTSQDRHGVYVCKKMEHGETMLRVKNATKQGYEEAHVGDGINLAYPESETRRGRVGKGCCQTLDCSGNMGTLMKCGRIRRLTPKECFRLQGWSDEYFERAQFVNSDSQLYKQAGNGVTVPVIYQIARKMVV